MPLAFIALALIMVLAACSGNPATSSSSSTVTSTSPKLVVYVLGLGESLSTSDASQKNNGYGYASSFYSPGDIQPYLQGTNEFKDAQSLVFSYRGFTADGKPSHFFCWDTFNNQLAYDVSLLNLQITQYLKGHPNTDVYIVAHSLGGVIAFGYMAQLIEATHSNAISDLGTRIGTLKGIAILDSPLGGVTNKGWYNLATVVKMLTCDPQLATNKIIRDFQGGLFQNASSPALQGETASILNSLGGSNTTNQKVASDAANLGVSILITSNENDLLWRPEVCGIGPDFLSTEYLKELGRQSNGGALYSRSFANGLIECPQVVISKAHHFDVLHRTDVEKAIWETFTGNPMDQLSPVTDLPGGEWISVPASDTVVTQSTLHLAAKAYPTHKNDPSIQTVKFTLEVNGTWTVICSLDKPSSGNVYTCDVDLSKFQFSVGQMQKLKVSFDVIDKKANVNLAPNGIHTFFYVKQGDMTGFSQFVGTWSSSPGGDIVPSRTMVIQSNGKATYTGYVGVSCSTDSRSPCDSTIGGLNTIIVFYRVDGTTADGPTVYGVIVSGTGDRDSPRNILPIGSNITGTLIDPSDLFIDGIDLPRVSV